MLVCPDKPRSYDAPCMQAVCALACGLPRSSGEHLHRIARQVGARPSRTVLGTSLEACDTRSVMTILVSQAAINQRCPFSPRTRPA